MTVDPWPDVPGTIESACNAISDALTYACNGPLNRAHALAAGQALGYLRRDADWLRTQLAAAPASERHLTAEECEAIYDEIRGRELDEEQRLYGAAHPDRCHDVDGIRVQAAEPPTAKTRAALNDVFDAARRAYAERHPDPLAHLVVQPCGRSHDAGSCAPCDIQAVSDSGNLTPPVTFTTDTTRLAAVNFTTAPDDDAMWGCHRCGDDVPTVDADGLCQGCVEAANSDEMDAEADLASTELAASLKPDPEPATGVAPDDGPAELSDDPAVIEPQPAVKKKRNLSDAERERRRQSAYAMQETRRVKNAAPDQLTTCHICEEPRLVDGDHTCRKGRVLQSVPSAAPPAPPAPTCTSTLADTSGPVRCTHQPHHDGLHSWDQPSPIETTARPPVPAPPKPLDNLTPEARAQVDAIWAANGARR